MKTQRALNDEQERLRVEGLRALARIIARHALAHQGHGVSRSTGARSHTPPSGASHGDRERPRRNRTA